VGIELLDNVVVAAILAFAELGVVVGEVVVVGVVVIVDNENVTIGVDVGTVLEG
jgi:hypothetical protein